jgi:protein SCO1/2
VTDARVLLAALGLALAGPAASGDIAASDERARDYFTDTALLDQDARPVRFYSDVLRDRTVAIGFVFTRCLGACPLVMEKLGKVRALLGASFGQEVHFVAISVDPDHDTPAALRRFAALHRAVGPGWTLLTGTPEDVRRILQRLGAAVDDPGEHSTGLIAGNTRSRHWTRIRPDAVPQLVARQLAELAAEPSLAVPTPGTR